MHRSVLHIPDAELHVMQVIWDAPVPLSTTQIIQTVQKEINPAWKMSTIRTFLARLITKGYLTVEFDSKERYYIAVADEQNPCHILKPLESIDISGLAGVLGHFLLLTLLAYPGIKWHSFDPESSRKGSKSRGLIPFYYPPLATRFSSACASSKPRWV